MELEAGTKVVLVGDAYPHRGAIRTVKDRYADDKYEVSEAKYWVEMNPESDRFKPWGAVVPPEDYKWRIGDTVKLTGEGWTDSEMLGETHNLSCDENFHGGAEFDDETGSRWDVEHQVSDYYGGDYLAELVKIAHPEDLLVEDEPEPAHKVGDIVRLTGNLWAGRTTAKFAKVTEIRDDGAVDVVFNLSDTPGESWYGYFSDSKKEVCSRDWGVQWVDSAETLPASEQEEYDRLKFPNRVNATLEEWNNRIAPGSSYGTPQTVPYPNTWEEASGACEAVSAIKEGEEGRINFQYAVSNVLGDVRDMLVAKNTAYGNSALDPVRIFSDASPIEQLKVRIDDKLSRLQRGSRTEDVPEDTVMDLIGYLVLFQVAKNKGNK